MPPAITSQDSRGAKAPASGIFWGNQNFSIFGGTIPKTTLPIQHNYFFEM
jgi:hypothetical protein